MAYESVPSIKKRALGSELRRLREAKGLTYEQVGQLVGASRPKILRQEQGVTAVPRADLEKFFDLYEVTSDAERDRLEYLRQRGWFRGSSYGPLVPFHIRDLADAERISTSLRMWEVGVVPGIFQTPEYTHATISGPSSLRSVLSEEERMELSRVREERKYLLDRASPPMIFSVIGEGALRTLNGGRDVLRDQIKHLIELSERPYVSLQVLPFTAGENPGAEGSFLLMRFDEGLSDQAFYIESARLLTDEPKMLAEKSRVMDHLIAQAPSPQESRAFMMQISATL